MDFVGVIILPMSWQGSGRVVGSGDEFDSIVAMVSNGSLQDSSLVTGGFSCNPSLEVDCEPDAEVASEHSEIRRKSISQRQQHIGKLV